MSAGHVHRQVTGARLSVALVATLVLAACGPAASDPAPTVALAEAMRGALTVSRGGADERVLATARVEEGASVATADDARGALALDGGGWVLLDRASRAVVSLASLRLEAGRAWVDASQCDATTLETGAVRLVAHEATFAVALEGDATVVYVGSGEVAYVAPGGEGQVSTGETLRVSPSAAPATSPEALWEDWTGGLADPARGRLREDAPIGLLAGRAPYARGEARTPLPVRGHEVNVALRGELAVTEVVQTFFNARSETLEGEWAVRLPPGALVESFAVDTGAGFVDAAVSSVSVGASYARSWLGTDTAESRLVYDGPGRVRARVYPIANGATVRVRLRYTEWLARRGSRRTYTYPMRADGEPPLLGELVLTVDTHEAQAGALRAGMGAVVEDGRVVLRASDVRPRADFTLDLDDAPGRAATPAVAVPVRGGGGLLAPREADGDETYVLFDVDTGAALDAAGVDTTGSADAPLELVIVLDASGGTETEDLELARSVVAATLHALAPTDRVTLRLGDLGAHPPDGVAPELVAPDAAAIDALLTSLARLEPAGATDLGEMLREAASVVAGRPRGAVLYLGDAIPTTGGLDATALRTTLATLDAPPRFFALGLGDGANLDLLRALFGEGARGVADREGAARAVMQVLAEAARPTLRGVTVDLGPGIERVFPSSPSLVAEGAHLRLVGRAAGALPAEVTVRGSRDGAPFEARLPLTTTTVDDAGDVRRRWATERLYELLDEDAGREAMVELGTRFGLVTPWTSLVIGGAYGQNVPLIRDFDVDPLETPWGLGGGGPRVPISSVVRDVEGWRRRVPSGAGGAFAAEVVPVDEATPERTWEPRVGTSGALATGAADADGGLARVSAERVLATGERGPRQCYERRAIVRPDLAGDVTVSVSVGGDGAVRDTAITGSSLRDAEVEACVRTELSGLRFPASGGAGVTVVTHIFSFTSPERALGARRVCSDASRAPLDVRARLWRERLDGLSDGASLARAYRAARDACELPGWRARRLFLELALRQTVSLWEGLALHRDLRGDPAVAGLIRRALLRRVRTPDDVALVRRELGLEPGLAWWVFARAWGESDDATVRLRLVRRWLEVAPDDLDLRLRLLSLLEQTDALPEARRVANALRADPLADARVRTEVGEFWLRQGDEAAARRVFSEIVEHAPLDAWARRRLGDLYRAHGWPNDAYREYQTLARLRPNDGEVLLLLARAAADAGRTDEALRLEQRLAESDEPGADEGVAASARLWTAVRLARLLDAAPDEPTRAAVRRRARASGALRDAPDALVLLTFEHPDDALSLAVRWPSAEGPDAFEPATLGAARVGLLAVRLGEREAGEHRFRVRRADLESLRDTQAELLIVLRPGTPEARIVRQPLTLSRTNPGRVVVLGANDEVRVEELGD